MRLFAGMLYTWLPHDTCLPMLRMHDTRIYFLHYSVLDVFLLKFFYLQPKRIQPPSTVSLLHFPSLLVPELIFCIVFGHLGVCFYHHHLCCILVLHFAAINAIKHCACHLQHSQSQLKADSPFFIHSSLHFLSR